MRLTAKVRQVLECPKKGLLNYILSIGSVVRYALCQPHELRPTLFSCLRECNKLAVPSARP
jgi:hypothetical protein